jgi:hypothetical protein
MKIHLSETEFLKAELKRLQDDMQALALDKKAEEHMIYKTFEQWKSGNVLEHSVPRIEHYSEDQLDLVEMGWNYGYDAGRAVEQALDKKAENARELGLDYEPAPVQATMKLESSGPGHGPAPNQKLSVRHVSLIDAGKTAAQPAVPDAIGPNEDELPAYAAGWNDCRAEMLKAREA